MVERKFADGRVAFTRKLVSFHRPSRRAITCDQRLQVRVEHYVRRG